MRSLIWKRRPIYLGFGNHRGRLGKYPNSVEIKKEMEGNKVAQT